MLTRDHWCQFSEALDHLGNPVGPRDPRAVRWSLTGYYGLNSPFLSIWNDRSTWHDVQTLLEYGMYAIYDQDVCLGTIPAASLEEAEAKARTYYGFAPDSPIFIEKLS